MPSAITNERQKSNGGTNGHKTNGHGANGASTQPRDEQQHYALLVSQEIMRLVDASKEGRLSEREEAANLPAFIAK